jgi:hypothetical protein
VGVELLLYNKRCSWLVGDSDIMEETCIKDSATPKGI